MRNSCSSFTNHYLTLYTTTVAIYTTVVSDSLLYADDTCIVFQHKNVTEIEKQLLRDFSSLCNWFVDNKLSVHFNQDKTKSILFGTKHKLRHAKALNIVYNGIEIKQYEKVKYLGCVLDQSQWLWT